MVRQVNYHLNKNHKFVLRSFTKNLRKALLCCDEKEKGNQLHLMR